MAPSAASTTTTRRNRVLHLLFPSHRAVFASAVVEAALSLLHLPLLVHVVLGLLAHVVLVFVE
jgi:hypothetical protein